MAERDPWEHKFSFARVERPVQIPAWMDREQVERALTDVREEMQTARSTAMPDLDLDALEAAGNAATVGPWVSAEDGIGYHTLVRTHDAGNLTLGEEVVAETVGEDDAAFIATARNNWDWLIAQARAVEELAFFGPCFGCGSRRQDCTQALMSSANVIKCCPDCKHLRALDGTP